MLLLLLYIFALVGDTDAFNSSRCAKEMKCFAPSVCLGSSGTKIQEVEEDEIDKIESCSAVVAIRPYSDKKWLIAMRGIGLDPEGLQLSITKPAAKTLFKCKASGVVTVDPSLAISANYTNANLTEHVCEFEVTSSSGKKIISPESGTVQLKYVVTGKAEEKWTNKASVVSPLIDPFDGCNADDILFESDESSVTDQYQQADSRQFEVNCPADWQLTGKLPSSGYAVLSRLACSRDEKVKDDEDARFKYQWTSEADNKTDWVAKNAQFSARCSQKRCLNCPEVSCDGDKCSKPKWTPGSGDSCAQLECEGDRFEVSDAGRASRQVVGLKPVCLNGNWTLNGTQPFTNATCFKNDQFACPAISKYCANCTDTGSCSSPDQHMTITRADGSSTRPASSALKCDQSKGKWIISGTKDSLDLATVTIACGQVGSKVGKASVWRTLKFVAGILLTVGCGGGLILNFFIMHRLRTRRPLSQPPSSGTPAPPTASGDEEDKDKDKEKEKRKKKKADKSTRSEVSSQGKTDSSPPPKNAKGGSYRSIDLSKEMDRTQSVAGGHPQNNPTPEKPPMDDDHGYVVIDPALFAAEQAAAAAKKKKATEEAAAKAAAAKAAKAAKEAAAAPDGDSQVNEVSAVAKTPAPSDQN